MRLYVFVPLTDELLDDNPELIDGSVLPYNPDFPCHHWNAADTEPDRRESQHGGDD